MGLPIRGENRKRRPARSGARIQQTVEAENSDNQAKAQAPLDPLKVPLGDLVADWLRRGLHDR